MTEREQFEKWATQHGHNLAFDSQRPGHYYYVNTEALWQAWQASRDAALESAAVVCDGACNGEAWRLAGLIRALKQEVRHG